jgi:bifunctional UDP-N-acetylglucosamine pyrophosphorylase/glucosamine-1-phosphate N-acetyltransferase
MVAPLLFFFCEMPYATAMLAVILAAGYGTRMGDLTKDIPKPMLSVCGMNLIEHKIRALPEKVTDVVLVVGYKAEVIRAFFKTSYAGRSIHYVDDTTRTGTAHALFAARACVESLTNEPFFVLMGDDIYDAASLHEAASYSCALICKPATPNEDGGRVECTRDGLVERFVTARAYALTHTDPGLIFTGGYVLPLTLFSCNPVKLQTKEEWGLPQTVAANAITFRPVLVKTDEWISITTPEDLVRAESLLCACA